MKPRFRIGTTSYIVPDDILPNVRYLRDRVEDVELVLFEIDEGGNNLPSPVQIDEMAEIAAGSDLTYTIHLPLDLQMGSQGESLHVSLELARKVIDRTRALEPFAYVLHLEGKVYDDYESWVGQAARSLEMAAEWAGDPALLAVENLEGYPLDFIDPVLEQVPASRCLDVGHLWLEGHEPAPFLRKHLARTRVVHIHGIGTRDHQSLGYMDLSQIREVLAGLESYEGVVTLEIFNKADLESSLAALKKAGMEWEPS